MEAVITLHEDRCYGESKWKTRKGEKGKYMTMANEFSIKKRKFMFHPRKSI